MLLSILKRIRIRWETPLANRYLRLKLYLINASHLGVDDDKRGHILDPCRCGIHIFNDKKIDPTQCDKRKKRTQTKKKSQSKLSNRFCVTDRKKPNISFCYAYHTHYNLFNTQSVGSKFNCKYLMLMRNAHTWYSFVKFKHSFVEAARRKNKFFLLAETMKFGPKKRESKRNET